MKSANPMPQGMNHATSPRNGRSAKCSPVSVSPASVSPEARQLDPPGPQRQGHAGVRRHQPRHAHAQRGEERGARRAQGAHRHEAHGRAEPPAPVQPPPEEAPRALHEQHRLNEDARQRHHLQRWDGRAEEGRQDAHLPDELHQEAQRPQPQVRFLFAARQVAQHQHPKGLEQEHREGQDEERVRLQARGASQKADPRTTDPPRVPVAVYSRAAHAWARARTSSGRPAASSPCNTPISRATSSRDTFAPGPFSSSVSSALYASISEMPVKPR